MDSSRHAYRFRMEEERAAVRAVLHFGAYESTEHVGNIEDDIQNSSTL